jgi:hypothetical protein
VRSNKKIIGVTIATTVLFSMTGAAQTLAQRAQHQYSEKMVNDELSGMCGSTPCGTNPTCGSALTAGFAWPGFDSLPVDSQGTLGFQPGQFGRECLQGFERICGSPDGKAAVKQKVQRLVIAYGGQGKQTLALAGGTLTYTIDPKLGNSASTCQLWLGSHL